MSAAGGQNLGATTDHRPSALSKFLCNLLTIYYLHEYIFHYIFIGNSTFDGMYSEAKVTDFMPRVGGTP